MTEEQSVRAPSAQLSDERRRYFRIPTVVPVDFQLLSAQQVPLDPEVRTGITRDLSEHGMCLRVARLPHELRQSLQAPDMGDLRIALDIPIPKRTLRVFGRVAWSNVALPSSETTIGVEFVDVAKADGALIAHFAKQAARRPKIIRTVVAGLALAVVGVALAFGWQVMMHRRAMAIASQQVAQATKQYDDVAGYMEKLTEDLSALSQKVRMLTDAEKPETGGTRGSGRSSAADEVRSNIAEIQATIAKLKAHQTSCFCWP
jgi:hypothetical protein